MQADRFSSSRPAQAFLHALHVGAQHPAPLPHGQWQKIGRMTLAPLLVASGKTGVITHPLGSMRGSGLQTPCATGQHRPPPRDFKPTPMVADG